MCVAKQEKLGATRESKTEMWLFKNILGNEDEQQQQHHQRQHAQSQPHHIPHHQTQSQPVPILPGHHHRQDMPPASGSVPESLSGFGGGGVGGGMRSRRSSGSSTAPHSPVEPPQLDLSHLSEEERAQIEAVMMRARQLQQDMAEMDAQPLLPPTITR